MRAEDEEEFRRFVAPRQRAALVLRYCQGLSLEETAAVLGCSVGTANRHLRPR
ncbi:hypothetical protein Acsp01_25450 [Actinoplanes sp. NBRC 101535]|nr:hypothetical protein Acsp01_25450 [Actinoplanes sp. NBRC 101535]